MNAAIRRQAVNTCARMILWRVDSPGNQAPALIGAAIIKAVEFQMGFWIGYKTLLGIPSLQGIKPVAARDHKPTLLTQAEATDFLVKLKIIVGACGGIVAVELLGIDINPVE